MFVKATVAAACRAPRRRRASAVRAAASSRHAERRRRERIGRREQVRVIAPSSTAPVNGVLPSFAWTLVPSSVTVTVASDGNGRRRRASNRLGPSAAEVAEERKMSRSGEPFGV